MNICDLYIAGETNNSGLGFVKLFDNSFVYDGGCAYSGFLNINVGRVKLISVVSELRKAGVTCFSVPVKYRDGDGIDYSVALQLAENYARSVGGEVLVSSSRKVYPPLFWIFEISCRDGDVSGREVIVDRLDGHLWQADEYEGYMYDYNNIF